MRKRKTISKAGADSNRGEESIPAHQGQQGAVEIPAVSQQMDEATITVGDMIRAMQYLTEEVTNLRYKLLQYELCPPNRKK
jgi:hypothetical protein